MKILETIVLRRMTWWEHDLVRQLKLPLAAANKPNPAVDGARRVAAKVKGKALGLENQRSPSYKHLHEIR